MRLTECFLVGLASAIMIKNSIAVLISRAIGRGISPDTYHIGTAKPAEGLVDAKPSVTRSNGVLRTSVAWLLFLCVSVGWSVHALAACPQPATTVFFVNGINTSIPEASASLDALRQRLGPQLQGDCLNFAFAYNSTSVPLTFDSDVVDANVHSYRAELALRNKVILVAHSNGNVYADEAYGRLTPAERTGVGVVAVATLLGSVPGNGPYVTLVEDTYLTAFPGHLPANTTNTGGFCPEIIGCHAFVGFYLNGEVSGPRIVQDVSDTIPRLVRPPGGTFVALDLNETDFGPGDTIRAGLRVTNGGPTRRIDFYLDHLFPDGVTVSFITSLSPLAVVTVTRSEPEKFQPLVRNAEMQQGLDLTMHDAVVATLPPNFPEGQSVAFAAITAAGTLELVAPLATAEFAFEP
jgi:hypothetical protein